MTSPKPSRNASSSLAKLRPVTLKVVAKAARVSEATVSYILRGRAREMSISTACEQRVRAAAERLGYQGNYHARSLALQSNTTIGMAVGSGTLSFLHSPFFSSLVAGCELQIRRRGYDLHLIGSASDDEVLRPAYEQLRNRRVAGLIIFPFLHLNHIPKELLIPGLPVVFAEGPVPDKASGIVLDPCPGIRDAVDHLHLLGHRHIAWMGVRGLENPMMAVRLLTLREQARRHGIRLDEVRLHERLAHEDLNLREALGQIYQEVSTALALSPGTTALVCENDAIAMAALKVLADRGIRVPHDLSVVGFDDIYALLSLPSVTTISHRLMDIGAGAVDMVLDLIAGTAGRKPVRRQVPSTLIVRESTGPAPSSPGGRR